MNIRVALLTSLSLCCLPCGQAQVFTMTPEQLTKYTSNQPFDRFPDGRPKVPDNLLEKVRGLSVEEVWSVLPGASFLNQYEGNWQLTKPGKKLVGRAFTVQFMPMRPDVRDAMDPAFGAKGSRVAPHQRVIDLLQPGDVLVVDLNGRVEGATIVGDNLAMAIQSATQNGGLVVDGAIRDLEGITPLDMPVYFRGAHPSAISYEKFMLTGVNIPVRIGNVTVLPGDVVFGDREGIYFIPPAFVQQIITKADETHIHDEWTKGKFSSGRYKSSDLYPTPKDPAMKQEYDTYKKSKMGEKK